MTMFKVNEPVRKPLFEGVQGENEARSIQFDITPWVDELGDGVCTAKAKRSQDSVPYPVTVTKDGNTVTWKPTSTDTAYEGIGAFQLEYTVDSVLAKTCVWSTVVAPSLATAGDPPDPYDDWLADLQDIAADALQDAQDAEAWAVGQRGGVDVPNTDDTYENNAKYYAELAEERTLKAFAIGTASGAVASFSDGADDIPMKSCIAHIEPQQAGSGTPSPDNVRAITGWTGANVTRCGRNLFDKDNGDFKQWSLQSKQIVNGSAFMSVVIQCKPSTTYTASKTNGYRIYMASFPNYPSVGDTAVTCQGNNTGKETYYTTNASDKWLVCWFFNSNTDGTGSTAYNNVKSDLQIEEGATKTAYEPYTATTYPVTWTDAGTVYGGYVDLVSGVLTVTQKMAEFDGSADETIIKITNSYYNRFTLTMPNDCINPVSYTIDGVIFNWLRTAASSNNNVGEIISSRRADIYLPLTDSNFTSVEALRTYLGNNPLQVIYPLDTTTTYQLTPTEVKTLLGSNNVWSDTGDTDAEYRKDPTIAWNELANAIVALGGNI